MNSFFDISKLDIRSATVKLYILRNMTTAGVFVANKVDDDTLEIGLDYAIPQYRDFKLGNFLFESQKAFFLDQGYTRFIAKSMNPKHTHYLLKMGFVETLVESETVYVKTIK